MDTVIETNLEELKAAFDALHRQMLNINHSVKNIKNIAVILNASSFALGKAIELYEQWDGSTEPENPTYAHVHMYTHTATPTCHMGIQAHKHAQTQIMSL